MHTIEKISAREIIDSRGNPTLEVICTLTGKVQGTASVPSGMSTGSHEVLELRDNDQKRYHGMGVLSAVEVINTKILPALQNQTFTQEELDNTLKKLDGTKNKSALGGNAILGVSLAFAKACANEEKIELYEYLAKIGNNTTMKMPQPMFNIINGGKHAGNNVDIQEFMIGPIAFDTLARKVQAASEVTASLKKLLKEKSYGSEVGDEGGFAPTLSSNEEALSLLVEAIKLSGYTTDQIKLGIDVAASNLYKDGMYTLTLQGEKRALTADELVEWYKTLTSTFPIISIEDGLAEDDWEGFSNLLKNLNSLSIVGDDLTVTNIERIKIAKEKQAINTVLIKPNQIGTLTETIEAIRLTKEQGWKTFASHRSGETNDVFIADLAVGLSCDYIKAGAPVRGERVCKYNRLMEIETQLQS